ncbi:MULTISPECIES: helix-turn-helix transcriptional regulator [unclassified Herbaspirillum]|uniref:helix-turn-helix domain-containing protein n=1 Tax=unclassified Herbaspirillum TaxID=2624150 RepID=UPI0025796287|nr:MULTISPECIES: helix-turn-helix transcriptional regulator [unclassified Herbaspirillum]|tara:strand:+ start:1333 stop:1563 length:231 start_codon:yes stop_codon:yes gene_type:complete
MSARPIHAIRLKNTLLLADTLKTHTALAEMLGMSEQNLSQYLRANATRNIGNTLAQRIEKAFDKSPGWLDLDQEKS